MNKYFAWIDSITPSFIFNDKSIEQISLELVSLALEIKSISDKHTDEFSSVESDINNKITNVLSLISEYNQEFTQKRESVSYNIQTKETETKTQITKSLNDLNEMVNNFYDIYFTKYPLEFDKGINDVNYDLTNSYTAYYKWNRIKQIPQFKLTGWNNKTSSYWYDETNKKLMYNDHESTDGNLYSTGIYQNKMIIKSVNCTLGDVKFPVNEVGYFIGFSYTDNISGIYFAESESNDTKKYDLKFVDSLSGEITKYENLVLPSDFNNVWLEGNSHNIIFNFNDEWFLLYKNTTSSFVNVCRSTDLIHFAKVGEVKLTGEVTFRFWYENYAITSTTASFVFNEVDNSFKTLKYNNKDMVLLGEFNGYEYFISNNTLYATDNAELTNVKNLSSFNIVNLDHAVYEKAMAVLGGVAVAKLSDTLPNIIVGFINKHSYYTNISTRRINNIYLLDDNVIFSYNDKIVDNDAFKNIDILKNKNLVINDNGDIYVDTTLQKVTFNEVWEQIL